MGDKAHPLPAFPRASTAASTPPAARRAVSQDPGLAMVSKSSAPRPSGRSLERPEVLGGVDLQQLLHRGSPGRQGDDGVAEASTVDALEDGLHPAGRSGCEGPVSWLSSSGDELRWSMP